MGELTYRESLAAMWLLLWRGMVIGGGLGFLVGFVLGLVGSAMGHGQDPALQVLIFVLATSVSIFYVYPLIIRMALRKQFKGFRLQVTR